MALRLSFCRIVTLIFTSCLCFNYLSAEDALLMKRDGSMSTVKITQYNPEGIKYVINKVEYSLPFTEIYMISTKDQGARFVNDEGMLVNMPVTIDPTANETFYLVNGGFYQGNLATVGPSEITYENTKLIKKAYSDYIKACNKGKVVMDSKKYAAALAAQKPVTLLRDQVFMIWHTKTKVSEILTPLPPIGSKKTVVEKEVAEVEPIPEPAAPVQELKYHRVTKGQTLEMIASRYGVTPEEIIEWNDLSPKTNPKGYLTVDMQLAIYVDVIE